MTDLLIYIAEIVSGQQAEWPVQCIGKYAVYQNQIGAESYSTPI